MADKAAQRAQRKAERAAQVAGKKGKKGEEKGESGAASSEKKGQEKKGGKQQQQQQKPSSSEVVPSVQDRQGRNTVSWFSHLPPYLEDDTVGVQRHLHPRVLQLGLLYKKGHVSGSSARCVALLRTIQYVIQDYEVPQNEAVNRHLPDYLSPALEFLFACRKPVPVSMSNAVNWLRRKIADPESSHLSPEEAKDYFCMEIDKYVEAKIKTAQEVIVEAATSKIVDGDVILTYSSSYVVECVLIAGKEQGKQFEVFVVDSPPRCEGKKLLKQLKEHGIQCNYALLTAASYIVKNVSKVFLGVSCLMSNGNAMARAGTSLVAMAAKSFGVPVLICCESIKFTEKVWLDSLCQNELGNPNLILSDIIEKFSSEWHSEETKLKFLQKVKEEDESLGMNRSHRGLRDGLSLLDWESRENIKLLNLLYDVTPVEFIDAVVSDVGMIPPSSVAVVLREFHADRISVD